jgi:hypothetical protein
MVPFAPGADEPCLTPVYNIKVILHNGRQLLDVGLDHLERIIPFAYEREKESILLNN